MMLLTRLLSFKRRQEIGYGLKRQSRLFHTSLQNRISPLIPGQFPEIEDDDGGNDNRAKQAKESHWASVKGIFFKCVETGLITLSSLMVLVLGGVVYHEYYKQNVLEKIKDSFNEISTLRFMKHKNLSDTNNEVSWVEREEQGILDAVISGDIVAKYFMLVGEKGTGKFSAVMESMRRTGGADCSVIDCSSDLELMRLRIGHSLHFEFSEDYIGSLFSMKGPRDATPLLDIERAFSKLETILVERKKHTKKPLVLIFNNSHLIDPSLVELLQQKAESFAASGMLSMVFVSDDYWLYEKFKNYSTRLQLLNFSDVSEDNAISIMKAIRKTKNLRNLPNSDYKKVFELIGGRLQYLNRVASVEDVFSASHQLIDSERTWFLSKCALLGSDMDDDALQTGKFSCSAMLLMREFVEMDRQKRKCADIECKAYELPKLPLWRAHQIMTRSDFIQDYDKLNIFTIDTDGNVRPDSVAMMTAFHEIADYNHFDEILRDSIDRVSEIESLNRTRELVLKDLVDGGKYKAIFAEDNSINVTLSNDSRKHLEEEEQDNMELVGLHVGERKLWWKKRMEGYNSKD